VQQQFVKHPGGIVVFGFRVGVGGNR